MSKFKCSKCGYAWTPRTWNIKNKCPYCGKEGTLYTDEEAKFTDINELLK